LSPGWGIDKSSNVRWEVPERFLNRLGRTGGANLWATSPEVADAIPGSYGASLDLPGLGHHGIALRLDVDPELLVLDTGSCSDLDSPAL